MNLADFHPETLPASSHTAPDDSQLLYAKQITEASDEDFAERQADYAAYKHAVPFVEPIRGHGEAFGSMTDPRAVQAEFDADHADFSTYEKRCDLAARGIFSIDRTAKRAAVAAEKQRQLDLDAAYAARGLDRRQQYAQIGKLLPFRTDGIWITSTAAYCNARDALDRLVFRLNARFPLNG